MGIRPSRICAIVVRSPVPERKSWWECFGSAWVRFENGKWSSKKIYRFPRSAKRILETVKLSAEGECK